MAAAGPASPTSSPGNERMKRATATPESEDLTASFIEYVAGLREAQATEDEWAQASANGPPHGRRSVAAGDDLSTLKAACMFEPRGSINTGSIKASRSLSGSQSLPALPRGRSAHHLPEYPAAAAKTAAAVLDSRQR